MNLSYQETSKPQTISEVCGQDKESFARYMKTKEAYLKIYDAAGYPTETSFVTLSRRECALLLELFEENKIMGFIV